MFVGLFGGNSVLTQGRVKGVEEGRGRKKKIPNVIKKVTIPKGY